MTRNFSPDGVPGAGRRRVLPSSRRKRRRPHRHRRHGDRSSRIDRQHRVSELFRRRRACGMEPRRRGSVHAAGGRIMPQIWHVGMRRAPATGPHPDALVRRARRGSTTSASRLLAAVDGAGNRGASSTHTVARPARRSASASTASKSTARTATHRSVLLGRSPTSGPTTTAAILSDARASAPTSSARAAARRRQTFRSSSGSRSGRATTTTRSW